MNTSDKGPCPTCGKPPRGEMDARRASEESGIALRHYRFCPVCFYCLSLREAKALGERAAGGEMIANVYSGDRRLRLRVETADLQEIIFRYGFDVVERIEAMTPEALAEVERIESLPYVESRFEADDQGEAFRAWRDTLVIPEEPSATTTAGADARA